jgi:hypothetical protein
VIEKELMYLIRGLFVRFDFLKEQVLGFFVETRLDSSIFPDKIVHRVQGFCIQHVVNEGMKNRRHLTLMLWMSF